MKKYLLTFVLVLCISLMFAGAANAESISGTCGSAINWVLDESGALTISGNGNMTDYSTAKNVPWYSYKNNITSVVIEEGITSVGNNAFRSCEELLNISLPETLTDIGKYAFRDCVALEKIAIPSEVAVIEASAFEGCGALSDVSLGTGITSIGDEAFVDCAALKEIKIPESAEALGDEIFTGCDDIVVAVYYGSAGMTYCENFGYSYTALCKVNFYSDNQLITCGEYTLGEKITLPENTTAREGYNFMGWEIGSLSYSPGDNVAISGNLTIFAMWEIQTFDIVFETNGGTNPAPITKKYNEAIMLPSAEKEGYIHLGWSESENAKEPEYDAGDLFALNKATTLYGVWEMKTYTIKFDTNGGSPSIENKTKRYFEKLQLPDTIPAKEGSTFMGWGISSEAVAARYQPGGLLSENGDITLYAVWKSGIVAGDADNNGKVNIADLLFMVKRLNNPKLTLSNDNKTAMDVFGDTYFNIKDVLKMAQYLAGWTNIVLGE